MVITVQLDVFMLQSHHQGHSMFTKTGLFSELPPSHTTLTALGPMNRPSGNPGYGPELYLGNPESMSFIQSLVLMHLQ